MTNTVARYMDSLLKSSTLFCLTIALNDPKKIDITATSLDTDAQKEFWAVTFRRNAR